jgi:hypothetical protein
MPKASRKAISQPTSLPAPMQAKTRSVRRNTTGHQSQVLQEPKNIGEACIRMFPRDFTSVLRGIIAAACIYVFLRTSNADMLVIAYAAAEGSLLRIMRTPDGPGTR